MSVPPQNTDTSIPKSHESHRKKISLESPNDTWLSVLYSWLGAFAPIFISLLIFSFASKGFNIGDFSRNGDFFIIADGLVVPSLMLLVKNRQIETTGTASWLMLGIIIIVTASTSFGIVKLLTIVNLPTLHMNEAVVYWFSAILVCLSLYYTYRLQSIDDERVSKLAVEFQEKEEKEISETVNSVQQEATEGTQKLLQDFERLRQDDK